MPISKATIINLTEKQRNILEKLERRHSTAQGFLKRVQIILEASKDVNNTEISKTLNITRYKVRTWRNRWKKSESILNEIEVKENGNPSGQSEKKLHQKIKEILTDIKRSGAPPTFTAEQAVQIIAIACEKPEDSSRPVTNWTTRELADEAIKRGIVESISERQVGRFLKRSCITTASE